MSPEARAQSGEESRLDSGLQRVGECDKTEHLFDRAVCPRRVGELCITCVAGHNYSGSKRDEMAILTRGRLGFILRLELPFDVC